MLDESGFTQLQTSVVHKEPETPHFQTLLAVGNKPRTTDNKKSLGHIAGESTLQQPSLNNNGRRCVH